MHPEMIERMMRTLDHESNADEVRGLQTHLLTCADCAGEWAALLAIHQQLTNASLLAPAPGFAPRVMQRLAAREQNRARYRLLSVALVFVLGSLGAFALTLYLSPFGDLFSRDGVAAILNDVVAWMGLLSALTRVADLLGAQVLEHVNTNLIVLAAFVAFGLTLAWARLVSGVQMLNPRPDRFPK